jgi:hypothetical protein
LGLDFISTCTPTFTRGWDTALADVQTADLFTDLPTEQRRTYRVTPGGQPGVQSGDSVFLHPQGDRVVVVRGRTPAGEIASPPPALLESLRTAGRGIATGTVTKLHPRSGAFDVRVN